MSDREQLLIASRKTWLRTVDQYVQKVLAISITSEKSITRIVCRSDEFVPLARRQGLATVARCREISAFMNIDAEIPNVVVRWTAITQHPDGTGPLADCRMGPLSTVYIEAIARPDSGLQDRHSARALHKAAPFPVT